MLFAIISRSLGEPAGQGWGREGRSWPGGTGGAEAGSLVELASHILSTLAWNRHYWQAFQVQLLGVRL